MLALRSVFLTAAGLATMTAPLLAGGSPPEFGNVCIQDYQGGAVCTANDVRFESFTPIQVLEGCTEGTPGEATIVFEVVVSADGSPDRYDIGMFIALDGGSALTGDDCFHDYLDPPLTTTPVYGDANGNGVPDIVDGPWWDGEAPLGGADTCGDMETNTEVIKTLVALTVTCVDTNDDGIVDVSACASWDNQVSNNCSTVQGAFPGTPSKCSCVRLETGAEIPVELIGLTVE
ncbi:MAG: hypothetical protein ACRD0X_01230 [Thermoanaerobaculia bacterium]